jgi:MOSC domain-containing protein YiiM
VKDLKVFVKESNQLILKVEFLGVGDQDDGLETRSVLSLDLQLEGVTGDKHTGFTRRADARDEGVKRGTPVRNWRQWSAVSVEELDRIKQAMSLPDLPPELLGANICFSGNDSLTLIPRGSMIWFPSGAVLTVEGENEPCMGPGRVIAKRFPQVQAARFPKAAKQLRGLVGIVYRAGVVKLGDQAVVRLPVGTSALPPAPV